MQNISKLCTISNAAELVDIAQHLMFGQIASPLRISFCVTLKYRKNC